MTNGIDQIVSSGLCLTCGGCAFASGGKMRLDRHDFYTPDLWDGAAQQDAACPLFAPEVDEDALADKFFRQWEFASANWRGPPSPGMPWRPIWQAPAGASPALRWS